MSAGEPLRIGFIPLVDAAILLVAVDKGFAAAEGLNVELARDVSWSNVRDKLAVGHYDAAHLLAPIAIASTLGLQHAKAPIIATFNLALNGNAITVSPALLFELRRAAEGDLAVPQIGARALAKIVREREARGQEPLTFGMTFPFSVHNYQLRYWMAEGGVEPDEDVRLIVLPPPYMVDSLARGQVDGFCVGAPWNLVARNNGVGEILYLGCEIFRYAPEKTLAFAQAFCDRKPALIEALIRACLKAAEFANAQENRDEVAALLARPDRVGVDAQTIRRVLDGRLPTRGEKGDLANERYLVLGDRASGRPDTRHAIWLYAQMVRWRQAQFSKEELRVAESAFCPQFFDAASSQPQRHVPAGIGAFAGADLASGDLASYLASFAIGAKC
jgi:ABC-type nitrate/sulfonate/bicarbonate transport system substrate-binding protein